MVSKITLKTEKRPTKVSDHAISRAVEKAYATQTDDGKYVSRNHNATRVSGSALSQSRKRK